MATNYTHPGLYIEEVPSAHTIQGAPTSVAAFVGMTEQGLPNTPTLITSWAAYQRAFGGLIWHANVPWAVFEFFNEGGGQCYVIRAEETGGTAKISGSPFPATAASPGSWGNVLGIVISNADNSDPTKELPVFNVSVVVNVAVLGSVQTGSRPFSDALLRRYVQQNSLDRLKFGTNDWAVLESFSGFTVESLSSMATRINASSVFIRVTASPSGRPRNTPKAGPPAALAGGTDVTLGLMAAVKTLSSVQGVSLLSVPDTPTLVNTQVGLKDQGALINEVLGFCEQQANLFYVVDPPFGLDPQGIINFKSGQKQSAGPLSSAAAPPALNSSYGAIYYPWFEVFNPIAGVNVPVPPSGATLGRYAYTDNDVGVHKSPAGVKDGALRTVSSLATSITDSDQDVLNPLGINAIRNLINYGNVIWGARTLSLDGDWTYIAVRRFFMFVEQSMRNSMLWVVFEPHDQRLWAKVTRDIGAFLTTLWHQGAIFGSTPAEAFFVVCDESNNPPEERALGRLHIDIGIAPVEPAEFVVIRISQKTAGPDSGS